MLEIGTHIGASLIHIASALSFNKLSDNNLVKFVSLDIVDVNNVFGYKDDVTITIQDINDSSNNNLLIKNRSLH